MKKVLAVMMSLLMVVALFAGCGNDGTPAATPAPSSNDGTPAATPAGSENADPSAAVAPIKIGMTGPLTGGAAIYGTAVEAGMKIAVEEINAAAGENGLKIEFKSYDDEHNGEKAVNGYNSLKDWGMQFFAGTVTTGPALSVAPYAVQDNIFMLTPSASSVDVPEYGDNIFQMCFTDPNQGASAAEVVYNYNPDAKIGIIYDSSDDYSIGLMYGFTDKADELGLNIVTETSFSESTKADLSTQVGKCKSDGCDLVFMPFYYEQAAQILNYANSIGYAPTFVGCDGMDGLLTLEGFNPAVAEGLILLTPFSASNTDAATVDFVTKYKAMMNGTEPNQFAADGYDVIYAIYNACVATGVNGDTSASDACDAVAAYFTSHTFDGLTGSDLIWSEEGTVTKNPEAVKIVNGRYVAMN